MKEMNTLCIKQNLFIKYLCINRRITVVEMTHERWIKFSLSPIFRYLTLSLPTTFLTLTLFNDPHLQTFCCVHGVFNIDKSDYGYS